MSAGLAPSAAARGVLDGRRYRAASDSESGSESDHGYLLSRERNNEDSDVAAGDSFLLQSLRSDGRGHVADRADDGGPRDSESKMGEYFPEQSPVIAVHDGGSGGGGGGGGAVMSDAEVDALLESSVLTGECSEGRGTGCLTDGCCLGSRTTVCRAWMPCLDCGVGKETGGGAIPRSMLMALSCVCGGEAQGRGPIGDVASPPRTVNVVRAIAAQMIVRCSSSAHSLERTCRRPYRADVVQHGRAVH